MAAIRWLEIVMNEVIKSYLFIPSGIRNFIERGVAGWRFVFFLFIIFCGVLAFVSSDSLKDGVYIFMQPIFLLIALSILSGLGAIVVGAHEPLIKAMRLVGLCLPPLGLSIYFIAEKSPLALFLLYPAVLYVVSSIFLGPHGRLVNMIPSLLILATAGVLSYFFATSTDKWFDRQLTFDDYQIKLENASIFSEQETRVYRYLLFAPPLLGHCPQIEEIADALKIDPITLRKALIGLDEKGRIVLGADYEIRYAYPWATFDNGFAIIIDRNDGTQQVRLHAASALHALSVPLIVGDARIKVQGRLHDTGQVIEIEITGNKIHTVNYPEAQVYKSDIYSEINFYSGPAGAKTSYRGRFDSTRLLNLDRAMVVAAALVRKNAAGIL